ncbi:MAG: PilZ domain-containing protein [Terriglobia bacterium]
MTAHRAKDNKDSAQRAQRFAVEIPVRYRETGSVDWQEGTTVNVSASGILFRSAQSLRPRTALDVALTLPVAISGEAPAEIGCRGTVVREVRDSSHHEVPMLAVSIARYRFVHKRRARTTGG